MRQKLPIPALTLWFQREKRSFPWRENRSPYAVWISEVMLQQTRAEVVIAYFERWMARFPSLEALARSSLDEVLKAWEGLGYYSRARYLHRAAKEFVLRHGGKIPSRREELEKIPGLGPYTVGAILSFAFHKKAAAVDSNVARVMARYFALEDEISKSGVQKRLRVLVEKLLPKKEPWVAMEALIELGAAVCQRRPQCEACPLQDTCEGRRRGIAESLPKKSPRRETTLLKRSVAVIAWQNLLLVKRGEEGKVMADLYEFPYFEGEQRILQKIARELGLVVHFERFLPPVSHTFTRFKANLLPILFRAKENKPITGHRWVSWEEIARLPFSSGHRKILAELANQKL